MKDEFRLTYEDYTGFSQQNRGYINEATAVWNYVASFHITPEKKSREKVGKRCGHSIGPHPIHRLRYVLFSQFVIFHPR
jgi:hypothetical protein